MFETDPGRQLLGNSTEDNEQDEIDKQLREEFGRLFEVAGEETSDEAQY